MTVTRREGNAMREWKPGTVGMIDARGNDARVMFDGDVWVSANGARLNPFLEPRPLVVLDPDDMEQMEHLAALLVDQDRGYDEDTSLDLQAALRSLVEPQRPDEPTGLGAVVEDAEGARWVRVTTENLTWPGEVWQDRFGGNERWNKWADIAAVKVLSEGVTEDPA